MVGGVFSGESLWSAIKIGIAFLFLSAIGVALMGGNVGKYIIGFPVVYVSRLAFPRDCGQCDDELLGTGVRYFCSPHRTVHQ